MAEFQRPVAWSYDGNL